MTHVYAFGSLVRGDFDLSSDIDVLAVTAAEDARFDPEKYSLYTHARIRDIWEEGNAFAWHLHFESRLIYSSDDADLLRNLGPPSPYRSASQDCRRFRAIFRDAKRAIENGSPSTVFELSAVFLALRNIATFYSLTRSSSPQFGRDAALNIGERSLCIQECVYDQLREARILATRGQGKIPTRSRIQHILSEIEKCEVWVDAICEEVTDA